MTPTEEGRAEVGFRKAVHKQFTRRGRERTRLIGYVGYSGCVTALLNEQPELILPVRVHPTCQPRRRKCTPCHGAPLAPATESTL
jgi:hypothetical protein